MGEYNQENGTTFLEEKVWFCDGIEDLQRKLLPLLTAQKQQWQKKIRRVIEDELKISQSEFERISGFSRQTVNKWCNGAVPRSREHFIRIGLVAGYDIEQMNDFLQKYGRYPKLYAKTPTDCVCEYVMMQTDERSAGWT